MFDHENTDHILDMALEGRIHIARKRFIATRMLELLEMESPLNMDALKAYEIAVAEFDKKDKS